MWILWKELELLKLTSKSDCVNYSENSDGKKRPKKNSKQKTQKSYLWRSKCEPSHFEFEFIKRFFGQINKEF